MRRNADGDLRSRQTERKQQVDQGVRVLGTSQSVQLGRVLNFVHVRLLVVLEQRKVERRQIDEVDKVLDLVESIVRDQIVYLVAGGQTDQQTVRVDRIAVEGAIVVGSLSEDLVERLDQLQKVRTTLAVGREAGRVLVLFDRVEVRPVDIHSV